MMANSAVGERPSVGVQNKDSSQDDTTQDEKVKDASSPRKPSLISRIWAKSGLNVGVLMMMVKGALPPTISLAIYQSTPVAELYTTIGYLIAIMAALSFAILPRSKFIQTMLLNVIGTCIGAAFALLQIYCSVQARAHTTPAPSPSSTGPSPGAGVSPYNSSAAAVCAIWLFASIYVVNTLRALRPQLQFPAIIVSIFMSVASVYAPSFPTMTAGISFTKGLLEAFLTGFAIATGVSLFVFPTTVRMTFFKQSAGFIGLAQGALKAQTSYLQSLETADMFAPRSGAKKEDNHPSKKTKSAKPSPGPETQNLKAIMAKLGELHGKIYGDVAFAKREMAWGKLDASDISEMMKIMQLILLSLTGMSSATDISQRIAEKYSWTEADATSSALGPSKKETAKKIRLQWNEIMKTLHDPFEAMTEAMSAGLQHTLYALELAKPPKKAGAKNKRLSNGTSTDIEAEAAVMEPGEAGYAKYLEQKINMFHEKRKSTLTLYCQQRGIHLDANSSGNISEIALKIHNEGEAQDDETRERNKRQLYLVLHVSNPFPTSE